MAEKLRNEVDITILGAKRTMRATFSAIRAIETELGKSMVTIIREAADKETKLTDAAVIIFYGLNAFGDTRVRSVEEVGEALMAEGFANFLAPVVNFVSLTLAGESLGKPEPETDPAQ